MRIFAILIFVSFAASAQVRPYQTTRLVSTGGAGVGSLLVSESAVLNPASLSFFTDSFASYQRASTSLKSKNNTERNADGRPFSKSNVREGFFVFDNTEPLKGGFSMQNQRENGFSRERLTGTLAAPISESVGFGILVRHTEDVRPNWSSKQRHKTSNPIVLGLTWVAADNLTAGLVYDDPTNALKGEARAVAGIQYNFTQDLLIMLDGGGDPKSDFKDRHLWRAAAQFNLFSDFFIRAGRYKDNIINEEGFGYGVSWTGPKLGVDLAMKQGRQLEREKGYIYPNEKLAELSFALNLRF